ncbi:MAG: bifunctional glutamate N-acetyltransferase/amino-acid acetyltransferase ArgJ [Coriobacteriales bacterium]|jgi:glutamate N-acetyltransferase/amino-acid N-acetyltransferase
MFKEEGIRKEVDFFDEAAEGVTFIDGGVTRAVGIQVASCHAGFRANSEKRDLALVVAPENSVAAGVFTTNKFCAAPVQVSKRNVADGHASAIILNSGTANAATGGVGIENAEETANIVAAELGIDSGNVLVASTGVIGTQLPMDCFVENVPDLASSLGPSDGTDIEGGFQAASAIMTTDAVTKQAAVEFTARQSDGSEVTYHIGGMSKGSGMISPNMATMLCVVATDAMIEPKAARAALKQAADISFNRVTVDSDMSTNDSLYLLATGGIPGKTITLDCPVFPQFVAALKTVCVSLAKQMAADGEGATKLVTVKVTGAADDEDALVAAKSVANSPLVKTAIAGHDANWGRLAAALGKSSARFKQEDVSIELMGIEVMRAGLPVEFDEEEALRRFENDEIVIHADLGCGNGASRVWTCDFTHGYITINSDYRS